VNDRSSPRESGYSRTRSDRLLWVVKLGGSLANSVFLKPWLTVLAQGGGRLVVVPGGGAFAEAVRTAQRTLRFDDATAHRMALRAMEQYATMLCRLEPSLHPVDTLEAMVDALARELVPVWLPARMVLAQPGIEASWDVTSDSLAAWLAAEVGATALTLVKAMQVDGALTADVLARAEVVDRAFPAYYARCGCACSIVGAAEHAHFRDALRHGTPAGITVL
jgi:aspartokinase-like uncharacterized kinase